MKKLTRPAGRPGYRKLVYNHRFKKNSLPNSVITTLEKKSEFLFSFSVSHGEGLTGWNFENIKN